MFSLPSNRCALACAGLLASAWVGIGCSGRDAATLSYVYHKQGMTEQLMISDQQILENTSGVTQVIPHLASDHQVTIELMVDADNKVPGLEKALELGYQQVPNH